MNNGIKIAIAILALGAAAYLIVTNLKSKPGESDFSSQISHWQCTECKAEFTQTQGELRRVNDELGAGPPPCPKCSKRLTTEMFECDQCKGLFALVGHSQLPDKCPHCKKPLGKK